MKNFLVTADEMRQYEYYTINEIGIPSIVLMEHAAMAAMGFILEYLKKTRGCSVLDREGSGVRDARVLVMAGMGNNGGDGLALARLLAEQSVPVDVWYVGDRKKASDQWQLQHRILQNTGRVNLCDNLPAREYTILVDALFGVGLARDVAGDCAEAIRSFNEKSGYKLALDVPSGIDSDTGKVRGYAVRADATLTFGFAKRGLYLYPGAEYAGEIRPARIGISYPVAMRPRMFVLGSVRENLPERDPAGNKGTFGKVLLIAGADGMAGAAVLAARAAYRVGAGMVKVLTAQENRVILQKTVPEALYGTAESLTRDMEWADVIAAGPGIGRGAQAAEILKRVVLESDKPLVLDADGLNLLAEDKALQSALAAQKRGKILTPHVGELARLLDRDIAALKEALWEHGMELAQGLDAVVVAKDARTYICREREDIAVNVLGNSGMATAGSGDVLTGAIAGLYGQFLKSDKAVDKSRKNSEDAAYRAACSGVLIHAAAGERAAAGRGEHGCMAGDIADALAEICAGAAKRQD